MLDLFWNGFVNEGVVVVGEFFKENNMLIDLDLSNNRIFIEGVLVFSKGF